MPRKKDEKLRVMMKQNSRGLWDVWVGDRRVIHNETGELAVGVVIGIYKVIEEPVRFRGDHNGK